VYADGKIIYNLLDGHTVAIDAITGREVWKTQIGDMQQGETTPMAPFVAGNRVIVGPSGGEFGIWGWVKGLDVATGRILWTAHNMGPDSSMLARPGHGRYTGEANIGVSSWEGDSWRRGGAPVWGWISYDPQLDVIYFGTGNPGPYNTEQRPGENKWTNSVLARRPGDGSLVWAYQFTPHDSWDYDSNAEMILVDMVVGGRMRKVLVHFDKNGFAYTLDRVTGELLVAEPFANVTWAKGINKRTGLPIFDTTKMTGASRGNVKDICPSLEGGKSPASPSAYSPRTGLFYTAMNNLCMNFEAAPVTRIAGTPYIGATTPYYVGPGGNGGEFIAWDAARAARSGDQGEVSRVERQRRHRRRCRLLRHVGRLVQGRRCQVGARVVEVQSRLRCRRRADLVSRTRREAVRRGVRRHRRRLVPAVRRRAVRRSRRRPAARRFRADLARHTSQGGIVWIFGL